jgi:predicted GNAT family N-acyltransferase
VSQLINREIDENVVEKAVETSWGFQPKVRDVRRDLRVVVFFKNESIRYHYAKFIESTEVKVQQGLIIQNYAIHFEYTENLQSAADRLIHILESGDDLAGMLISDALVQAMPSREDAGWKLVPTAKTIRDRLAQKRYVSVAVLEQPTRIPNIDLVLAADCAPQVWLDALELLIARLSYFARPAKLPRPEGIEIRPIQSQIELYNVFKLRYEVYKVMGYLDEEIEKSGVNLELHWCDTISLHFGAFLTKGSGTELVGTSRIVLTSAQDQRYGRWTQAIAQSHPELRRLFERQRGEFAPWRLPIFHTMELNKYISDDSLGDRRVGELSRVVVHEKWRGTGLSSELVNLTIAKAEANGVDLMLLECLEIHEKYYNKFGFISLEQSGEVVGIGKTMIGMIRPGNAKEARFRSRP